MARTGRSPRYAPVTDRTFRPETPDDDRIVAIGLLTQRDLAILGSRFDRVFPVNADDQDFSNLLEAIDAADRRHRNLQR